MTTVDEARAYIRRKTDEAKLVGSSLDDVLLDLLWENPDSSSSELSALLAKRGFDLSAFRVAARIRSLGSRRYQIVKKLPVTRHSKQTYRLESRTLKKPVLYYYKNGNVSSDGGVPVEEVLLVVGALSKIRWIGHDSGMPNTGYVPSAWLAEKEAAET